MDNNYLRRLRRRALQHDMVIRTNRSEEGGYRLIDVSGSQYGFDVFGGPVDLEDIEKRLNWMEADE